MTPIERASLRARLLVPSVVSSLRHAPLQRAMRLPIVSTVRSRVLRARGARVELDGRVTLGYLSTQVGEVTQSKHEGAVLQLARDASARLGDQTLLGPGARVIVGPGARFEMGERSFVNGGRVVAKELVTIGRECAISWDVLIMDTDFHQVASDRPRVAPVRIGDRVWVGAGAMVLKGVTVGDGSVVAAGAIVTKDVPKQTIVAGNPARVVRENVQWAL